MRLLQEFKQFLLRGNVVDLAVAIVIGVAFAAVVTSFVAAFLTPVIAIVAGRANVSELTFTLGGATFPYGQFLNALLSFVLVAAAVFFFVIKPVNALVSRSRRDRPSDPTTKKCPFCTLEIPIDATRCPNCTSELQRAA
jgi:large conductance mechanosensitive channel